MANGITERLIISSEKKTESTSKPIPRRDNERDHPDLSSCGKSKASYGHAAHY